jgi:uncharacterized membrane protein
VWRATHFTGTSPKMLVSTTADAPAFTPAPIKIQAVAETNGNLKGSTGTDQTLVTADFFSIIDAQATTTIQVASPQQQVSYPITVTNFGNAQTKVFFEVSNAPEGWQVIPPQPTILESKQQGGKITQTTVYLTVQTPWKNGYMNTVGAITMKITTKYALDPKVVGDASQISVLTTTKGFYVPGPDLTFFIVAIGVAAVVFAGRNRRGSA